jgi:metallo-beta-lactamase class B
MTDDAVFRYLLIAICAVAFPIGAYHRIKSESTRESLDRRQEGMFILATLRPLGFVLWSGLMAWMINPRWMAWSSVALPSGPRWAGVAVMVVGFALMVWTFRSLGKNLTDTVVTRREHTLVLHGPYRYVRHPFYGSAAVLVLGMSLVAANWFFLLFGALLLSLLVIRTRTEEANLVARFGDSYRAYMRTTGRFFPRLFGLALLASIAAASPVEGQGGPAWRPDPPKICPRCDAWNAARAPFRIFGNTYFVGVAGLSAVLIASDSGLILLDAALPQSALPIAEHIKALGFRVDDVRLIVSSHAHFDHVGAIAALQRASGAAVAASPSSARALERGEPTSDDPQFALSADERTFPSVRNVRVIADGETLRVGALAVTAHFTPGHTPGSTTWTWRSCEASRCLNMVYADSLNPVSAPAFTFTSQAGVVDAFRRSIAKVGALPCDILVSVHPEFSGLDEKLQKRARGVTPDPFVDPRACQAYARTASQSLDRRVRAETALK